MIAVGIFLQSSFLKHTRTHETGKKRENSTAGISIMFFSSGATGVLASQGCFGRHKYISKTCCIHLTRSWGTGVHRPYLLKLKIITSIWCITLSTAPIKTTVIPIWHMYLLIFLTCQPYYYASHGITHQRKKFPFQYGNCNLSQHTVSDLFIYNFFNRFCDLFIYGGVWGFPYEDPGRHNVPKPLQKSSKGTKYEGWII